MGRLKEYAAELLGYGEQQLNNAVKVGALIEVNSDE